MKRPLMILALALALFFPVAAEAQQLPQSAAPPGESAQPKPRLMIEDPVHDAGEIEPGALVKHEFIIKNEGDAPLEISEVKPGCGCSTAMFDRVAPPGGTSRISFSVQIYPEWAGQELRKTAWVLTNDPLALQVRLVISGQIKGSRPERAGGPNTETPNTEEER